MNIKELSSIITSDLAGLDTQATVARRDNQDKAIELLLAAGPRIYRPWIKDRLTFAFDNPKRFATEPKANTSSVFLKLLTHLRGTGPSLSDEHLIVLVNKFAEACTEREWIDLYQPILKRQPIPEVTTQDFNRWIEGQDLGKSIRPSIPMARIRTGIPQDAGTVYPVVDGADIVTFVIWEDSTTAFGWEFDQNGTSIDMILLEDDHLDELWPLIGHKDMDYPILIDAIVSTIVTKDTGVTPTVSFSLDLSIELVDVVPLNQAKAWPGAFRRERLEELYSTWLSDQPHISLADGYPMSGATDLDASRKHFEMANPGIPVYSGLFVSDERVYPVSTIVVPLLNVGLESPK